MLEYKNQEQGIMSLEQLNKGKVKTKGKTFDFTVNGVSDENKVILNGISYFLEEEEVFKDEKGRDTTRKIQTAFGQLSRTSKKDSIFSLY